MTTVSERLFEQFCDANDLRWTRVEGIAAAGERRPDYEVRMCGQRVIVEVKQFDPTTEERHLLRQLEDRGATGVFGGEPGDRARKKITRGAVQLRALSRGEMPSLLVLYNNVASLTDRHTHPYAIKTAMYGLEAVTLGVTQEAAVQVVGRGFAQRGKKRVTPSDNTSLSAVAVLREDCNGVLWLFVYHNIYARRPLQAEWLWRRTVRHFTLGGKMGKEFQEWVEVCKPR